MTRNAFNSIRRAVALTMVLILAAISFLPYHVHAEQSKKVIRVGWYESPFNTTDTNGQRTGYAYEYQRKIAAYTGWTYEYVEGSWPELLQMLKDGKIDLLSDVTYTDERADEMLFSSYSMGSEDYYLFVAEGSTDIVSDNTATINNKRIGINKGSVQADYFRDWAKARNVKANVIELTGSEAESQQMVLDGKLDAFVSLNLYTGVKNLVPLIKIGSSEFRFAMAKGCADQLMELDAAIGRIQSTDKFYNEHLHEKYFKLSDSGKKLGAEEAAWLEEHGKIRVAYQDNYLAFCAEDESGELTGALKDFLDAASVCMPSTPIEFEPISYPTATEAMEAVKNGEADCMFPANLTDADCEAEGLAITPTLVRTEMQAVVRAADQKKFLKKDKVLVAVNEGNANYDLFLKNHFPSWEPVYYKDTPACLDAVAAGDADCILISSYRYTNISKQCDKLHLTTVSTGVEMDYSFVVLVGNKNLYSILSRTIHLVPESTVSSALTYYSTEDAKTTFIGFIKDNILLIMLIFVIIVTVIIGLLLRSNIAQKKVIQSQLQVDNLSKRVYVDALTSVRNKGAYYDYVAKLQNKLDSEKSPKVAIAVLDCDNLKTINDKYGHDKGDEYLKAASKLICRIFQHSPVFRVGGDEFAVVLMKDDYDNKDVLIERFEKQEIMISKAAKNPWDQVNVTMGVAEYDPDTDSTLRDTSRRADKIMYEKKRIRKLKRKEEQEQQDP